MTQDFKGGLQITDLEYAAMPKLYQILAGIRGPDARITSRSVQGWTGTEINIAQSLKKIVTGRLRAILFNRDYYRENIGGDFTETPLTDKELKEVPLYLAAWPGGDSHQHFISHLMTAVEASWKHPIWGGKGKELLEALQHTPRKGTDAASLQSSALNAIAIRAEEGFRRDGDAKFKEIYGHYLDALGTPKSDRDKEMESFVARNEPAKAF
jgi:hypothetical protein